MTATPDGRHLSALTFHQNPLTGYAARAWIGERCDATPKFEAVPPVHFLNRSGQWTLNGLVFDEREQLIESMSRETLGAAVKLMADAPKFRFRIVVHEFHYAKQENQQHAEARLASLKAAFQAHGADMSRISWLASGDQWEVAEPVFAVQRLLWSRIDLQLD